jgi:hypothetical protein
MRFANKGAEDETGVLPQNRSAKIPEASPGQLSISEIEAFCERARRSKKRIRKYGWIELHE